MSTPYQLLINSLIDYYTKHPAYLYIIIRLNNGDPNLPSLRQIDYCVVNYAKLYKSIFVINMQLVDIYAEYRTQLKIFTKDFFDPFRRGVQKYILTNGTETTLCQLNFFRWAIPTGVLGFTIQNLTKIVNEMSNDKNTTDDNINPHTTIKHSLTIPNPQQCVVYMMPNVASF